jgi:transcriptional regulator with XRE-family HTH domain
MNIAQQLQGLLNSTGISRSRLARELGVHTSTVSNWLDGKEVKSENLAALCSYFGCTLDYLAGQTAEQKEKPLINDDEELTEYLDELRSRPEKRMLFSVTKNATKAQIEAIVKMIEEMKGD